MSYIYSISTPDDDVMDDLRRAYEAFGSGFDYERLVSWARDNSDGDGWGTFFNIISPNVIDVSNSAYCLEQLRTIHARVSTHTWVPTETGFMLELFDDDSTVTEGAAFMLGVEEFIELSYPILDDDDYFEREDKYLRDYFTDELADRELPDDVTVGELYNAWYDATWPNDEDCYLDLNKVPEYIAAVRAGKLQAVA
ncbi:hypothetical protein BW14_06910 [Bifidobacterium sp. UTBIF-68]|uniref:hypothetical protein n=1 Tax=Bifidobacterium sp. UTBIF-68 TaxID=1465262 RepID=UPI0011277913|nr:hypothetical protein [Bifidobacterium sp. UTBIF-68]TPF92887.1 hypothetical protein BW14_06910 [Bifidobacterium sp. UTBIF-68]